MEWRLPLLNLGLSDFERVRKEGLVYVDKTAFFPGLEAVKGPVFLARPRRFGKSLLVSALDAYFSGEAGLFQGLAAGDAVASPGFVQSPVVRLDMSEARSSASAGILQSKLRDVLNVNAVRHNVTFKGSDAPAAFLDLMRNVSGHGSRRIVLLADEYDIPVVSLLQSGRFRKDKDLITAAREVMGAFYSQIKTAEKLIRFAFITGVTKFSRTGVFSALNDLTDISLHPQFGEIAGFTQEELETNFGPYIETLSLEYSVGREEILDMIRRRYRGFSFDGVARLYNPYSAAQLFYNRQFQNYWMQSGSDGAVREYLLDRALVPEMFRMKKADIEFLEYPGEIDRTPPEGFLYQAGYLSLRAYPELKGVYYLDYPNAEVLSAVTKLFLENIFPTPEEADSLINTLNMSLRTCNVEEILTCFQAMFAKVCNGGGQAIARLVPGGGHRDAAGGSAQGRGPGAPEMPAAAGTPATGGDPVPGGSVYRFALRSFLTGAAATDFRTSVSSGLHTDRGRPDITVDTGGCVYIIGLGVSAGLEGCRARAQEGMDRIAGRGSAGPSGACAAKPVLISIAVDTDLRNIGCCVFRKDGIQEEALFVQEGPPLGDPP